MTKTDSRRYYPTALALYITYFVLGIAATIMGQYKQDFAALWGASKLADGSFDVSSVVAVIAAIGLGRLVAFPIAGPLSDRLGRRLFAVRPGQQRIFLPGGSQVPAQLHRDTAYHFQINNDSDDTSACCKEQYFLCCQKSRSP